VKFCVPFLSAWSGDNGGWMLVIGGAVVITLVMFRLQWKRARRKHERTGKETLSEAERQRERLIDKADEILLTIEEISRETKAVLDNRIRCLEALLDEADKKIKELRPLVSGGAWPNDEPPRQNVNPLHKEVWGLYDAGADVVAIARRMNLPPGEVQLILGLRPHLDSDSGETDS